MRCPRCKSPTTPERQERTDLGSRRFRCRAGKRECKERTGTRFHSLPYPTAVVCLVMLWRERYKLSLRDLPERCLERGLGFTHAAVREWEAQLAPVWGERWRKHRRGRVGPRWYADETFIKVKGRLASLYRAIDRDGNLVEVLLSEEKRDKAAAEACFRSARLVPENVPERVPTDGQDAYPGALKAVLGEAVRPRTNRSFNKQLEQDQRGITQHILPMGGCKSIESAKRFCCVHDEVRNFLRPRSDRNEGISRAQRQTLHPARTRSLLTSLAAAESKQGVRIAQDFTAYWGEF